MRRQHKLILAIVSSCLLPLAVTAFEELPEEHYMAEKIRQHAEQGRSAFEHQEVLNFIARKKAEDMAKRQFFSHIDPDGYGPNFAAYHAGYDIPNFSPASNTIESIGVRHQNGLSGQQAADIIFAAWLESPGHRRHVLAEVDQFKNQPAYGVGYAFAPQVPFGWSSHYFVIVTANADPDAVVTPFVEWKFDNFSLAKMDQHNADVDQDGKNLLWEYAYNTDPEQPDAAPSFAFTFSQERKQGGVTVELPAGIDPAREVIVETSSLQWFSPWTSDDVRREGNTFWAGAEDDVFRAFRVRLEHRLFSRLPRPLYSEERR